MYKLKKNPYLLYCRLPPHKKLKCNKSEQIHMILYKYIFLRFKFKNQFLSTLNLSSLVECDN